MTRDSTWLAGHLRDVPDFPKPGIVFKDLSPLLGDVDAFRYRLGAGFVPVRKPGKLPWKTVTETYDLEYGSDSLDIHEDAVATGDTVYIVDDVLATGGTAAATCALVERVGGSIAGIAFVVELGFLDGRAKLPDHDILSLITV